MNPPTAESVYTRRAGEEPIPGYRLLEPLGRGGFGEVWKCEVPGGLVKAIKIVKRKRTGPGDGDTVRQELEALEQIKRVRHHFLLSLERVESIEDELIIVSELADKSLSDRFEECQAAGLPGIPREELLPLLLEAAEVLDVFHFEHGLQHLDIKPGNLLLVGKHIKLADFGLVSSLEVMNGGERPPERSGFTPRYCAPETLRGLVSRRSDQYSLAIAYQELLTGVPPLQGKSARQVIMRHLKEPPDLSPLPASDQHIVARALAKDPDQRFPSCLNFVRALLSCSSPVTSSGQPTRDTYVGLALPDQAAESRPGSTITKNVRAVRTTPLMPGRALAHHSFLECLYRDALGEVWKAVGPDHRPKLVRQLPEMPGEELTVSEQMAERLLSLPQAGVCPFELLQGEDGGLFLVSDYHGQLLVDRSRECQSQGLLGIPHLELLSYLEQAAETLDSICRQTGLRHLNLNPRNMMIQEGKLSLLDVGLVELLWLPAGHPVQKVNPRYNPPEALEGKFSPSCDTYALALIYAEMLTSLYPRERKPRVGFRLNLSFVSDADREVLTRALHAEPSKRFAHCVDLSKALSANSHPSEEEHPCVELPPIVAVANLGQAEIPHGHELPSPSELLLSAISGLGDEEELFAQVNGQVLQTERLLRWLIPVRAVSEMICLKLTAACEHYHATVEQQDERTFVVSLSPPASLWQRFLGKNHGLTVQVSVRKPLPSKGGLSEALLEVRPSAGRRAIFTATQKEWGLQFLKSLATHLSVSPEKRREARWPFFGDLAIYPVLPSCRTGPVVAGKGKDISLFGVGFRTHEPLPGKHVYLQFQNLSPLAPYALLAQLVRSSRREGEYDWGATFLAK